VAAIPALERDMANATPLKIAALTPPQLRAAMPDAAWAFRGYNVTNLGRSAELLAHPAYHAIVEKHLREASGVASEYLGRPVDLVARVQEQQETSLESYGDAVALIVAMELAQLELLDAHFQIAPKHARFSFGYSLGEVTALVASGMLNARAALEIPLRLADDCAALANGVTLGILFSRGPELPIDQVRRLCIRVNHGGRGVVGISSYLSPNSVLLMGQGDTLDRFRELMKDDLGAHVHLRKNQSQYPPLHTPIVWQKNIPCRAAEMMHTMPGGFSEPRPPILSLVTGKFSYNDYNLREILHKWTDHPQRLWDAVCETLAAGIQTVIHVGPDPNIVPATFARLSENVVAQSRANFGMRALSAAARRPWLSAVLPTRTALLRAPFVRQIILEDWLLENAPATAAKTSHSAAKSLS
jgi:[acyl-carrier-protein] S-malonyltransferase